MVWRESYTYDGNGNRASKKTPWGTIEYEYDGENRLIRKTGRTKQSAPRQNFTRKVFLLTTRKKRLTLGTILQAPSLPQSLSPPKKGQVSGNPGTAAQNGFP
ncbi:MAG: hypothetical protein LBE02_05190 [Spirochaetaceae bacterium]|nr:hypothetical protein [Spirochaetaceae bacterium]